MTCITIHGYLFWMKFCLQLAMARNAPSHIHLNRLVDGVH
jgi:hypothetical protein